MILKNNCEIKTLSVSEYQVIDPGKDTSTRKSRFFERRYKNCNEDRDSNDTNYNHMVSAENLI